MTPHQQPAAPQDTCSIAQCVSIHLVSSLHLPCFVSILCAQFHIFMSAVAREYPHVLQAYQQAVMDSASPQFTGPNAETCGNVYIALQHAHAYRECSVGRQRELQVTSELGRRALSAFHTAGLCDEVPPPALEPFQDIKLLPMTCSPHLGLLLAAERVSFHTCVLQFFRCQRHALRSCEDVAVCCW